MATLPLAPAEQADDPLALAAELIEGLARMIGDRTLSRVAIPMDFDWLAAKVRALSKVGGKA